MRTEQPVWCVECSLRIAPYEVHTVYQRKDFHQNCFMKRVRREADDEIARRAKVVREPEFVLVRDS